MDLEENIFKENIPGRWSKFKDEESDVRLDEIEQPDLTSSGCAEEEMLNMARSHQLEGVPESVSKSILANRLTKPATGVKGVLADYQASCELTAAFQAEEARRNAAILRRAVEGSKISADHANIPSEIEGDLNSDGDDDEYLKEYRAKRLAGYFLKDKSAFFSVC